MRDGLLLTSPVLRLGLVANTLVLDVERSLHSTHVSMSVVGCDSFQHVISDPGVVRKQALTDMVAITNDSAFKREWLSFFQITHD